MRLASLLALVSLLGCASDGVSAWRPDGAAPPAALSAGAALQDAVAGLYAPAATEGDDVELLELRVLDLSARPWQEVGPDEAAGRSPLGLVAHRSCRRRDGLRVTTQERSSWMVFVDGALVAYDHGAFGPGCTATRALRPADDATRSLEKGLVRYAAQRYPGARPGLEETLRGGLVYLEAGRVEDAERALRLGERAIDRLDDDTKVTFGEEKEALQERIDEARRLRRDLLQAIQKQRDAQADEAGSAR